MNTSPLLQLENVSHQYSVDGIRVPTVQNVDLTVSAGDFYAIFGASGSGKSTLLKICSGILAPTAGTVHVDGHDLWQLTSKKRTALRLTQIGMVFQDHNLVSEFTAAENIQLILRARGLAKKESITETRHALELVGIPDLADRRPPKMSGGQAQRVGIARALAGGKTLILADEPTGALDNTNSLKLFELLRELAEVSSAAIVLCTHDRQAHRYVDNACEIIDGELKPC